MFYDEHRVMKSLPSQSRLPFSIYIDIYIFILDTLDNLLVHFTLVLCILHFELLTLMIKVLACVC